MPKWKLVAFFICTLRERPKFLFLSLQWEPQANKRNWKTIIRTRSRSDQTVTVYVYRRNKKNQPRIDRAHARRKQATDTNGLFLNRRLHSVYIFRIFCIGRSYTLCKRMIPKYRRDIRSFDHLLFVVLITPAFRPS